MQCTRMKGERDYSNSSQGHVNLRNVDESDSHNSTAAQRPAPDGTACIYGCIYGHLE